jgi:DNA-binding NarL/FixJ family response regulator
MAGPAFRSLPWTRGDLTASEVGSVTHTNSPASAVPLLWVDIVSPHPVVVSGLRAIIESALGSAVFTTVGPVGGEPDVVFYDVLGLRHGDGSDLDYWVKDSPATVIAVTSALRPDLDMLAFEHGAEISVPSSVAVEDLVEVVRAAMA